MFDLETYRYITAFLLHSVSCKLHKIRKGHNKYIQTCRGAAVKDEQSLNKTRKQQWQSSVRLVFSNFSDEVVEDEKSKVQFGKANFFQETANQMLARELKPYKSL